MLLEQHPTGDSNSNQDARGNGYERSCPSALLGNLELRKIAVARAAGSQVVQPLLRFGEWHFMRGDFPENIRARAPGAIRIRELLEQTTAQPIQNALFVSLRVPF